VKYFLAGFLFLRSLIGLVKRDFELLPAH